jgi:hypothetical protein
MHSHTCVTFFCQKLKLHTIIKSHNACMDAYTLILNMRFYSYLVGTHKNGVNYLKKADLPNFCILLRVLSREWLLYNLHMEKSYNVRLLIAYYLPRN